MENENRFYLEGEIELHEETAALKAKASKVIELPEGKDKQPDLLYFSAIFVSSGKNLNNAFFMPSELVAAEGTITNKALDIEHEEQDIIGHLYQKCFTDKEGNTLDVTELASRETANLEAQDIHIVVAGIIYKNRFPNIAKEVAEDKWKVSMECYFQDYDVKVGDLILDRKEAESLGLAASDDKVLGRIAKVLKNGKEIAQGSIARVLRGICFSGCGIVKNPANPPSIILETAKEKIKEKEAAEMDEVIILDYDKLSKSNDNKVTSQEVDTIENIEEARDGNLDDTTGICVSFKRRLQDKSGKTTAENWCVLYEKSCTSPGGDATNKSCLRNIEIQRLAKAAIEKHIKSRSALDKRKELLADLRAALCEAVKTQSR